MKPETLPVHRIATSLVETLREHPVVIVEGPTGCGKTTQIPQILLDNDLVGEDRMIGMTQPRRIAAVSVAHRIAAERKVALGREVGFAIRFDDCTSRETRIRVMTDGLLLQEARGDPLLMRYGVIVVDEAHERSINIDFTLGLLRTMLEQRDDLRIVISSATLHPRQFSRFFGGAPILRVDARTFPVEVQYQPIEERSYRGRIEALADLVTDIHRGRQEGDILAFLTGEAEIRAVMADLERRRLRRMVVVPLYGRLTREEQDRVFEPVGRRRKVVLATNIAETSLTVDGIRFVLDLGLAKVPSYDVVTGVGSLREQPISQASAQQRAGRAGRLAPGVCIRLYDRQDFHARPAFQLEEIRRMDLAEVVLRLLDLDIRDVEHFPFITEPPLRSLLGAVDTLHRMGAIDADRGLTALGRRMASYPLPPRMARMVVEASDRFPEVLDEIVTTGALLSVRWPYAVSSTDEARARAAHREFSHPRGDLLGGIAMMERFQQSADPEGFCQQHYLDHRLMCEILRVRDQLQTIAQQGGVAPVTDPRVTDAKVVHCIATGFPGRICRRIGRSSDYETATGVRVSIHPSSCMAQRRPELFVAASIVVTYKAWARSVSALPPEVVAEVDPALAERWGIAGTRPSPAPDRLRSIVVGSREVPVRLRKGKPCAELLWDEVRGLGRDAVSDEAAGIGCRLIRGEDDFLGGWTVGRVLRVAPLLRIDEPEVETWLEGELLSSERELWRILRLVPDLLRVARSRRRRRAGFLTLIPNGIGGFWFESTRDLALAVEQAGFALDALLEEDQVVGPDRDLLLAAQARIEAVANAI